MRRTTLLVVVTTLFLLYITGLAVISGKRSEANAYLDDFKVTLDGDVTLSQDFTDENPMRLITEHFVDERLIEGTFTGRGDVAVYSSSDYHSTPHSLALTHGFDFGTALLAKEDLPSTGASCVSATTRS